MLPITGRTPLPRPTTIIRFVVIGLALMLGAWLLLDGFRAVLVGDYTTVTVSGRPGQLGPWAGLLESLGVDPRSTAVKLLHLVLGIGWLAAAGLLIARHPAGPTRARWLAVLSLWYLPFGTIIGVMVLLLTTVHVRDERSG